jgi:hypothetical protein
MLEADAQNELNRRLARLVCEINVPRALQKRLARRGAQPPTFDDRRKYVRFSVLAKTLMEVKATLAQSDGPPQEFAVLRTDLSGDGLGFLHSAQLFPGDLVTVWFPTGKLDCRVARCVKHTAKCFEVGATFVAGTRSLRWLRAQCGDEIVSQA